MQEAIRACILEVLESAAGTKAEGVYLVGLALKGATVHRKIDVLIDADQGVTIAQCAFLSRRIRERLEDDEALSGTLGEDFDLTVGSPGLGEPLVLSRQYRRHLGRLIRISYTAEGGGEPCELLCRLREVRGEPGEEQEVLLTPVQEGSKGQRLEGEPMTIELARIVRAVPEPEL